MSVPAPSLPRTRWRFAVLFALAGSLVVGIVVLAFVWPVATAKAKDLPVGLAGPAAQVAALQRTAARQEVHPFDFRSVGSRADAVRRIRRRELAGAILLGVSPEVLTSSAASSVSNQALRGVAAQLQARVDASVEQALTRRIATLAQAAQAAQAGRAPAAAPASPAPAATAPPVVRITDVVPLSSADTTGAGLTAASLPLVLGGMLGGVLVSLLVVGPARRVVAVLVYGVAAGAVVTLVLQTWLGILQRDWFANAAAFGLAMAAIAAVVTGFAALLGRPGIAVGGIVTLLIGNPISGAAVPAQFLVGPWGAIGQWFVPGAASTLVRSLSYFPDADTAPQWLVLGGWLISGLLLTVLGRFRGQEPVHLPEGDLEPTPA